MKNIVIGAFALSLTATVVGAETTAIVVADAAIPVPGFAGATGVFVTSTGAIYGFIGGILMMLSSGTSSSSSSN